MAEATPTPGPVHCSGWLAGSFWTPLASRNSLTASKFTVFGTPMEIDRPFLRRRLSTQNRSASNTVNEARSLNLNSACPQPVVRKTRLWKSITAEGTRLLSHGRKQTQNTPVKAANANAMLAEGGCLYERRCPSPHRHIVRENTISNASGRIHHLTSAASATASSSRNSFGSRHSKCFFGNGHMVRCWSQLTTILWSQNPLSRSAVRRPGRASTVYTITLRRKAKS